MQRRWVSVAGLLILSACRAGSSGDHDAGDEIELAQIAALGAQASEVRTLAARILAKRADDLDALGPIMRERGARVGPRIARAGRAPPIISICERPRRGGRLAEIDRSASTPGTR